MAKFFLLIKRNHHIPKCCVGLHGTLVNFSIGTRLAGIMFASNRKKPDRGSYNFNFLSKIKRRFGFRIFYVFLIYMSISDTIHALICGR